MKTSAKYERNGKVVLVVAVPRQRWPARSGRFPTATTFRPHPSLQFEIPV